MTRRVMRGFRPEALIEARQSKELSKSDVGRMAGVDAASIGRWEAGLRSPQVDALVKVLDALDCAITDVVRISEADRYPGDWRVLRGLTQPELGKAAALSTSAVGRIERGEGALSLPVALKLSAVLQISVDELMEAFARAKGRPPGDPA